MSRPQRTAARAGARRTDAVRTGAGHAGAATGGPPLAVAALQAVLDGLPYCREPAPVPQGMAGAREGGSAGSTGRVPVSMPADASLRAFFAKHPSAGRRDRQRIADEIFDVLRHWPRVQARARMLAPDREPGAAQLLAARVTLAPPASASPASSAAPSSDGPPSDGPPSPASLPPDAPDAAASKVATPVAGSADSISRDTRSPDAAARHGLPPWLWAAFVDDHGAEVAARTAQAMLRPAGIHLRVNVARARVPAVVAALREAGIACRTVDGQRDAIVVEGRPALEALPAFHAGAFELQDLGSQALVRFCGVRRGQTVVDFCAGGGGKTLALVAAMRNEGRVLAFDVDGARLAAIAPRLARAGAGIVTAMRVSDESDGRLEKYAGRADLVVVDAPCSGTGTLQRHPDLKWRLSPDDVAQYVQLQRRILVRAARLVRPGGTLVYATCSVLRAENDGQLAWAQDRPEVGRRAIGPPHVGLWLPGDPSGPDGGNTGGFFAAKWSLGPPLS